MKVSLKALIYLSIALIIIISMFFIKKSYYLELRSDENKLYMSKKINLGDEFSVKFIHSVNKSPVIDYYIIKEDGIYVTKTKYYANTIRRRSEVGLYRRWSYAYKWI